MQPKRWIDYQDAFVKRSGFSRAISLSEALMLCDMQPCGRLHDGLDDAINTAKFIEMLESERTCNFSGATAVLHGRFVCGVKLECIVCQVAYEFDLN